MHAKQEEFSQHILGYVLNICKDQLSAVQTYANDNRVLDVLGLYENDLRTILRKVTAALPEVLYMEKFSFLADEIAAYIAKEYILFQVQESPKDPYFICYLTSFIYETINSINHNYKLNANAG